MVLASLITAGHFLRFGVLPLVLVALLLPLLLLARRARAVRAVQVWLLLGGLMFAGATRTLVLERQQRGVPSLRLSIIMGATVALHLLAAALLEAQGLRRLLRRLQG